MILPKFQKNDEYNILIGEGRLLRYLDLPISKVFWGSIS